MAGCLVEHALTRVCQFRHTVLCTCRVPTLNSASCSDEVSFHINGNSNSHILQYQEYVPIGGIQACSGKPDLMNSATITLNTRSTNLQPLQHFTLVYKLLTLQFERKVVTGE